MRMHKTCQRCKKHKDNRFRRPPTVDNENVVTGNGWLQPVGTKATRVLKTRQNY